MSSHAGSSLFSSALHIGALFGVVSFVAGAALGSEGPMWVAQFGTTDYDSGYALAPDGVGGVYIAGDTGGSLGGGNVGDHDAFIARYDASGARVWIHQFGTADTDGATALAADGAGGVFVAGYTFGNLDGQNAGDADAFIVRYDGAGKKLWTVQFGTSGHDYARGLAAVDGGVTVAGFTSGDLGGSNAGLDDVFLARCDDTGGLKWTAQFGTEEDDRAFALTPDDADGAYIAGWTRGAFDQPNAGAGDCFIARVGGDGQREWIRQFGTEAEEAAFALTPD